MKTDGIGNVPSAKTFRHSGQRDARSVARLSVKASRKGGYSMDMAIMILLVMNLIMVSFNGFLIIGVAGMIRKRGWRDVDDGK